MEKQIKLLVVDDNQALASEISAFMNIQQEVQVVGTAANAREALEMIKLVHPNAIIADLIMPQTDGFFLLERLATGEYGEMPKVIMLLSLIHIWCRISSGEERSAGMLMEKTVEERRSCFHDKARDRKNTDKLSARDLDYKSRAMQNDHAHSYRAHFFLKPY